MNWKEQRLERLKVFIQKGYTADVDKGIVYNSKGKIVGSSNKRGYIRIVTYLNNKRIEIKAYQFIYYISTGEVVDCIDHINGNKSDNRIINLRSVTIQENGFNQKKVKGGTWIKDRSKWKASIRLNGKDIFLGYFDTEEETYQAYINSKEIYHKIQA